MNANQELQEEFTFKKLWELIKRSAKRILIYALVAAVLGGCIAAVIAVTTMSDITYKGTLEFTHNGIINGKDPKGNVLDYNKIQSPTLINSVLSDMGYSADQAANLSEKLEGAVSIVPYIPAAVSKQIAENPGYTYYSTRYTIVVNPSKDIGMSADQYMDFINKLMAEYIKYFKNYYGYAIGEVSASTSEQVNSFADYYNALYACTNEIEVMRTAIAALPDSYSGIVSRLTARINTLASHLTELETYILVHNVQKENVAMNLADTIQVKIDENEINANIYKNRSESLDSAIEAYQQMFDSLVVGSDNKITISSADNSAYNDLVVEKKYVVKQEALYKSYAETLTKKKDMIKNVTCTEADRRHVEESFAVIAGEFNSVVNDINGELASYAKNSVFNDGVRVVSAAFKNRDISYIGCIAAVAIAIVIGVLAAIAVTGIKDKRAAKNKPSATIPVADSGPDDDKPSAAKLNA